jgi:hypothetical protein
MLTEQDRSGCPVQQSTELWLREFVIHHNVCPFAQRELNAGKIAFVVSQATQELELLEQLEQFILKMQAEPSIETALIIHPLVLESFNQYNQFLDTVDQLLTEMDLIGEIQIASFHPNYQFANTANDDPENFTNRSPYPMLHILREDSVASAIEYHADTEQIPIDNIAKMQQIGSAELTEMLAAFIQSDA